MQRVWSEEGKLACWLEVELAALEGWTEVGAVPSEAAAEIRERAVPPTPERVREIEARTHHDVAAFVDAVAEGLGPEGRWFHYGLTSSDVLDTATALQVREAGELVLEGLKRTLAAVVRRAEEHRKTIMVGRTHGVHAEPITFGAKLAGWAFELDRDRERIAEAVEGMRVGKLAGAVGTYGGGDPGRPARPPRGAPLRARRLRRLARALRHRDPASRPHRGAGGTGALRSGSEGLLGDAAQAQPRRGGADLRARPRRARGRRGWARERRSLARAGHLALERRARRPAGRVPRARLHDRPLRLAGRGPRRRRRPDATEPGRLARPRLQPACALSPGRRRALPPGGVRGRAAKRAPSLGRGARLPRAPRGGFRGHRAPRRRRARRRLRPARDAPSRRRPVRSLDCTHQPEGGSRSCLRPPCTSPAARSARSSSSTTSVCCSSPATGSPPSTSCSRPRSRTKAACSPASRRSGSRARARSCPTICSQF